MSSKTQMPKGTFALLNNALEQSRKQLQRINYQEQLYKSRLVGRKRKAQEMFGPNLSKELFSILDYSRKVIRLFGYNGITGEAPSMIFVENLAAIKADLAGFIGLEAGNRTAYNAFQRVLNLAALAYFVTNKIIEKGDRSSAEKLVDFYKRFVGPIFIAVVDGNPLGTKFPEATAMSVLFRKIYAKFCRTFPDLVDDVEEALGKDLFPLVPENIDAEVKNPNLSWLSKFYEGKLDG